MRSKALAAAAAVSLLVTSLLGCSGNHQGAQPSAQGSTNKKIEVVCTTFPAYDWVRQVVGDDTDRFDITYLMDTGVDLHSYQPTVEDIATIHAADLFVYVGGESDEWAEEAVEMAGGTSLHAVSMLQVMGPGAKEEEVVEGMEAEEEEGDAEEGPEYDEHVWLSLVCAQRLVDAIASELSAIDPANQGVYTANASAYNAQLAELDERYAASIAEAPKDTVVFADRFPFRYLADDYGLTYYAAFVGCSAETEASFETVAFLARKVDELDISTILVIEGSGQSIARAVIESTASKDQEVAVMDSLQSVTGADVEAGKTYLDAMEGNLGVLVGALA